VLRASPLFVWRDAKGVPWCDVIRESARKEFDAARRARAPHTPAVRLATPHARSSRLRVKTTLRRRFMNDPEEVNRLLISGRDYLDQTLENVRACELRACLLAHHSRMRLACVMTLTRHATHAAVPEAAAAHHR
jgi:hypothetical protein